MKNSTTVGLAAPEVDSFLPWRVIWDRHGTCLHVSGAVRDLMGFEGPAADITCGLFRPFRGVVDPGLFEELVGIALEWGTDDVRMVGGLHRLAEGRWLLLGSPGVASLDELNRLGIQIGALPPYLGFSRLLLSVEGARMAVKTNRDLAAELTTKAAELGKSLEEKTVLLREIHHRVKNNLAVISSMLRQQSRAVGALPMAVEAFSKSIARIDAIALVHRLLYSFDGFASLDAAEYLPRLMKGVVAAFDPKFRFEVEVESVQLEPSRMIPLGLLVTEALINVLKHGRSPTRVAPEPQCRLTLVVRGEVMMLRLRDWGPGLPEGFDPFRDTKGLGGVIANGLARQLRGELSYQVHSPGLEVVLALKNEPLNRSGVSEAAEVPSA